MTYNFPNKLRNLTIVFMTLGFLGLTYGFLAAPSSIKESKAMVSAIHNDGHGDSHENSHRDHDEKTSILWELQPFVGKTCQCVKNIILEAKSCQPAAIAMHVTQTKPETSL